MNAYVSAANAVASAKAPAGADVADDETSATSRGTVPGTVVPGKVVPGTVPRGLPSRAFNEKTETALLFTAPPKRAASVTLKPRRTSWPVLALTIVAESPSK